MIYIKHPIYNIIETRAEAEGRTLSASFNDAILGGKFARAIQIKNIENY